MYTPNGLTFRVNGLFVMNFNPLGKRFSTSGLQIVQNEKNALMFSFSILHRQVKFDNLIILLGKSNVPPLVHTYFYHFASLSCEGGNKLYEIIDQIKSVSLRVVAWCH